ncbi:MAG: SDR family NAD(P)-dependent oxidoreductase [Rhodospirillales bacterium]|nr:SDR family NAD(P)-dependent oxidoreductase [Rhodospirillales bacterium]
MRNYRRALITGATSGIGSAFASRLPSTTDLMLTGRDLARLNDEAQRAARPGRRVEVLAADLTLQQDRDRLVARAEEFDVDLLINNAGAGRLGRFLDSPADIEQQTVLLNVVAVVDLTRRLLPGMLARAQETRRRAGLIVVASTAAFAAVPMFATYAASKAFDLQFTEALAEELRDEPVDVVALCPGATRTNFGARAGWRNGGLPGAADPGDVAADALDALGRQTVCVPGRLREVALSPVVMPRRLLTGALGLAMRFVAGK